MARSGPPKRGKELAMAQRAAAEQQRAASLHEDSEDEDDASRSFLPQESAATAIKKSSTASKNKRKFQRNSEDSDTDQEAVREPLADKIHQNRKSIRTDYHQTMHRTGHSGSAKKRRTHKPSHQRKQNRELDDHNGEEMSEEEVKNYRSRMRLHAQNVAKSISVWEGMETAVKNCVNKELWKCCKFIKNEAYLRKATNLVMQKLNLKEMEGLSTKERIKAEEIWKEVHAPIVQVALNKHRNYVSGEIQKVYYEGLKQDDSSHLPNAKEIKQLMMRQKLDNCTDREEREVMETKFDTYVNDLLPKTAGSKWWGPGTRHYMLPSSCKHDLFVSPESTGLESSVDAVTPSDEAFLVVVVENSYAKWSAQAAKFKESVTKRLTDPDVPLFVPKVDKTNYDLPYTNPKAGNAKFGGWKNAGIHRFDKLKNQVEQNRADHPKYLEAVEKDALVRIQVKEKLLQEPQEEPMKKKAKQSSLMSDFVDEDAGDENDFDAW